MRTIPRRALAGLLTVVAGVGTALAVTSPATAAPTCRTVVDQVTVNGVKKTKLTIVGKPTNANKVYSFQLVWGWTNTTSTYKPTYRTYYAPRHTPLAIGRGWVNGYRCSDWNAGDLF